MSPTTTIVCGLERLGLRVVRAMIQLGEQVVVVAESPHPSLLEEARRAGARFVHGSSREIARLLAAHVETARCLVLTESADLGNLQAALAARERNPQLRIVMRMFNADMAHRATRLLSNSRVLSASFEAAPYFAAAALGVATAPTRHVWGRHLVVLPAGAGTPDGASPQVEGVQLGGGELLTPVEAPSLPRRWRPRRLVALQRGVTAFFDLRLGVTMMAISLLLAVSTVVFHGALRLSWVDALYFTVTTASTTGYGDINLLASAWWVKLYGVVFMFAAALSLATLFALTADAVIGARILQALGVPHGRMRNHVIVVGLGNTGYRIVQLILDTGVEVAAAELSERSRFVGVARRQGVAVLIGDGRYRDSLRALSAQSARAVVAVTDDDLANLETSLTARELSDGAVIVGRMFDPDLAEQAKHQLGIDVCLSVSALATPAFVAAALGDGVLSTFEHGSELWLVAELTVAPGSPLDGARTSALEESGGLHVLAVRHRGAAHWRPSWPEHVGAGHDLLVACTRERWQRLLARSAPAAPEPAARA